VVGLTAAGAPFLGSGSARADATYQALAYSTGVKFIFSNQSIPLGVAPQVQGPTAQAKQTSLQQSDAYAAGPYPGEDLAGIPGVAGGALGVAVPAYPFVVSTAYGDDLKQVSYPGLELSSESGDSVTQASATGGSKGAGATSLARIARTGEEISAVASTDTDALRLGEDLIITGLHASADAERDAAGKLTRTSALSFSNISVPGLALTVPNPPGSAGPPQKLTAPQIGFDNGTFTVTVPGAEPQSTPIPADQVFAAFAQAGYKVTYQAPQQTADGIIGAGLQFNTVLPAPPDGSPAGLSGTTPVTMSIGLAQAEISYGASQTSAGAGIGTAPPPATGAVALPETPVAPLPATDVPLPDAAPLPASAPAATVPTAALFNVDGTALTAVRTPLHSDEGWLFGVLAGVGLAVCAGAVLLIKGVRA
jgi:hypothetical protein